MFTVVLIGNSQSYYREGKLITPRGYYREKTTDATGIGQEIMINSFRTIEKELKNKNIPSDHKWALLHAIHTTADFEMENISTCSGSNSCKVVIVTVSSLRPA